MSRTVKLTSSGDLNRTKRFLAAAKRGDFSNGLESIAARGTAALMAATPTQTGVTANSWYHEVKTESGKTSITWHNSNTVNGVPLVILLQYGHATGTGGYVQGRDFINPALKPIFDELANEVWKRVTSA